MEIKYRMFSDIDILFPKLPQIHQILFCASLSERTIPNFKLYDDYYSRNSFELLRNVLDEVWKSLLNNRLEPDKIKLLIDSLAFEEYEEDLSSRPEAENAVRCLIDTLSLCLCPSEATMAWAIDLAHDSFYYYFEVSIAAIINGDLSDEEIKEGYSIFTIDDILPFREISERYACADEDYDPFNEKYNEDFYKQLDILLLKHPLLIKEIEKENEDLRRLQNSPVVTNELIQWVRKSSNNDGKSFLGIY